MSPKGGLKSPLQRSRAQSWQQVSIDDDDNPAVNDLRYAFICCCVVSYCFLLTRFLLEELLAAEILDWALLVATILLDADAIRNVLELWPEGWKVYRDNVLINQTWYF